MKTITSWTLIARPNGKPLICVRDAYISGLIRTRETARLTAKALNDVYGTGLYRVEKIKIQTA